jgi:hypothetical protein
LVAQLVWDQWVGGSNPLSPTTFEKPAFKAGFFSSGVYEDESLRRRFEPSEARQRCFSNGPQGGIEDASHPLSPTTFEKPAFKAGFFSSVKSPRPSGCGF